VDPTKLYSFNFHPHFFNFHVKSYLQSCIFSIQTAPNMTCSICKILLNIYSNKNWSITSRDFKYCFCSIFSQILVIFKPNTDTRETNMGQKLTRTDFEWVYTEEPHKTRRKEILRKIFTWKVIYIFRPRYRDTKKMRQNTKWGKHFTGTITINWVWYRSVLVNFET